MIGWTHGRNLTVAGKLIWECVCGLRTIGCFGQTVLYEFSKLRVGSLSWGRIALGISVAVWPPYSEAICFRATIVM